MLGTEELYFPFYDLGGTPWFDPGYKPAPGDKSALAQGHGNFGGASIGDWRKWDPSEHFAEWATPELVIHSSKDYRLPIAEGLAAFNVLQARGVESKLLTFPDEVSKHTQLDELPDADIVLESLGTEAREFARVAQGCVELDQPLCGTSTL